MERRDNSERRLTCHSEPVAGEREKGRETVRESERERSREREGNVTAVRLEKAGIPGRIPSVCSVGK